MIGRDGKPAPKFARVKGRLPPQLVRCPGCGEFIFSSAKKCPHCGGVLTKLGNKQRAAISKAEKALATLSRIFDQS